MTTAAKDNLARMAEGRARLNRESAERAALVAAGLELFGVPVKVARPEAMLVYKLLASRPKDLIDVESILEGRALAGHVIDWELTRRWAEVWGIEGKIDGLSARS